jgi:hypothetical protein
VNPDAEHVHEHGDGEHGPATAEHAQGRADCQPERERSKSQLMAPISMAALREQLLFQWQPCARPRHHSAPDVRGIETRLRRLPGRESRTRARMADECDGSVWVEITEPAPELAERNVPSSGNPTVTELTRLPDIDQLQLTTPEGGRSLRRAKRV